MHEASGKSIDGREEMDSSRAVSRVEHTGRQQEAPAADSPEVGFVEVWRSLQSANLLPAFLHRYDRPHTREAYRDDLIAFFQADFVDIERARSVSFLHVNQHIADMQQDGYKSSTIKRRIAAIRGFFEWLVAMDLLAKNPANRYALRRVQQSGSRDRVLVFLTAQQAERLVAATAEAGKAALRDRVLLLTLLHCVLRRSEAAAMDVEHIRPLGRYWVLDVPRAKGGADQYVKVPSHLVDDIEEMKAFYEITTGPLWRSLSNNSFGKRLSERSIYGIVDRTAKRAGLPNEIGAHSLRHTGCTLAIEAGASLQQVQSHARHKNIETTMGYIHQRDRLRDSAADHIHVRKPRD